MMLSRLPAAAWQEIFGNQRRVEIEIGPGTGTFLMWISEREPDVNYFAIERAWRRYRFLADRLSHKPRPNVRLIAGDASCILQHIVGDRSVAAYHIYFTDPWWKTKHHRRRLFTPRFAHTLARTLVDGGVVFFASDVELVDTLARQVMIDSKWFDVDPERRSPRSIQTSFERKGIARGARIYDAVFVKRAHPE